MRKKRRENAYCASDVETQPRPLQKKVLVNAEQGTKRELGMQKKGLGLWPFPFFVFKRCTVGPERTCF